MAPGATAPAGRAAAAAAALALLVAGCGEKDEPAPAPPESSAGAEVPANIEQAGKADVLEESDVPEPDDDATGAGLTGPEEEAVASARGYVAALDERNGEQACELLAPGAIDLIELPRDRGGCAASLDASIGYEDPRGLPVWRSADVEAVVSSEATGDKAKVIATVFTRFADRDEPSVEDDVIYLRKVGDEWRVEKPSLTLYRAVGQEPPPEAVAPPKKALER